MTCEILVPQTENKPVIPALGAWSLNTGPPEKSQHNLKVGKGIIVGQKEAIPGREEHGQPQSKHWVEYSLQVGPVPGQGWLCEQLHDAQVGTGSME